MKIEMYNDMYLQPSKASANRAIRYEASNQVDSESFKLNQDEPKILSMMELINEYGNSPPLFEEKEIQSKSVLHNYIIQSK